jgi:hypothetical protein
MRRWFVRLAGVEGEGDEGVAEAVWGDALGDVGLANDSRHHSGGATPIHPVPRGSDEERTRGAVADDLVDQPRGATGVRDGLLFAALAVRPHSPEHTPPSDVFDVDAGRLRHPQAIEPQQADQRVARLAFAVLAGSAVLLGACGSGADVAGTAGTQPTGLAAVVDEVTGPAVGATVAEASALLSGFPVGVRERFEYFAGVSELEDRMAATVSAQFEGFVLNPESGAGPNLYVAGYAGSAGVLRVFFEVERSLGGGSSKIAEAPGRPNEGLIAVDLPYSIPEAYQAEHFDQLRALEGASFILVLLDATIDNKPTGAYHLWNDPFAALAVDPEGNAIRVVHDPDLVSRDSVIRGAKEHPGGGSIPLDEYDPASEYGRRLPDLLSSLEGRPVDEVLVELQRETAPVFAGPASTKAG